MSEGLPSFAVIGTVKGATTWLAHQLRSHPQLWLPRAEPHYFSSEYARGLDWYRSLFAEAPVGAVLGEKSADYLSHPQAAERIARTLPGVRLIAQLRDPVDRAYSDFCMLYRRGEVDGDVARHLDPRTGAASRFVAGGRYAAQLRRLYEHVPAASVQVLLYEDVVRDPVGVATRVFDHIGVPPFVAANDLQSRHNDGAAALLPLGLRRLLRPMRPLLDPLRAVPVLSAARARMARPVSYPPMTAAVRARLRDFYRDDVELLGTMLGRDLSDWLNEEAVAA